MIFATIFKGPQHRTLEKYSLSLFNEVRTKSPPAVDLPIAATKSQVDNVLKNIPNTHNTAISARRMSYCAACENHNVSQGGGVAWDLVGCCDVHRTR